MKTIKGGRGHKASYASTLIKVPVPIKEELQAIANHWRLTGTFPELAKPKPLSKEVLEAEAKKLSKKSDLPHNWQAFIERILALQC